MGLLNLLGDALNEGVTIKGAMASTFMNITLRFFFS